MKEQKLIEYVENEIRVSLYSLDIKSIKKQVRNADKLIDLSITMKEGKKILIEIKSSGEPSNIYKAISQLKYYQSDKNEYLMVAAPSISEKSKEICKGSGIGYIDLTGNAFVKYGNVLIDKIKNKELPETFLPLKKRVKDIFSGDALRILIAILRAPSEYFTQEQLANQLNLSTAYVNRVLKTFEDGIREDGEILVVEGPKDKNLIENRPGVQTIGISGWIEASSNKKNEVTNIKKTKSYTITNPRKILDILAKKYSFNENKILSFYSFEKEADKLMEKISQIGDKNKLDYAFTLHAGASLSAPFVRFEDVYFYANEKDVDVWIKSLDLKRTEFGGNVFIVIPKYVWVLDDKIRIKDKKVANNILLYLDLINYPKRGKEQAEFLRERKIGY